MISASVAFSLLSKLFLIFASRSIIVMQMVGVPPCMSWFAMAQARCVLPVP